MAQHVKAVAYQGWQQSSVPGINMVDGKNQLSQVGLTLHMHTHRE